MVEGAQDVHIGRPQPATPPRSDLARDMPGGLYTGNSVYIFEYGTSADDKTTSLFTGSLEEVLARFVEDFDLLKPAPGPKTSKGKP